MVRRMIRKKRAPRRDAGRARGAPIAEAVLARTLEELATAGLEGLSVERIARSAEVNKTSIYRRWPTREALVAAALEGVLDHMAERAPDSGTLRGDLLGLLTPVAELIGQPTGRAVVRAALAEASESSVAALAARQLGPGAAGPVHALVERARARGEWRAGVRGEAVVGALVGAMIHRAMLEHGALTPRWLGSLVDIMLWGVVPRDPAATSE
jgi:AcrR family transcriptional regulator